MHLPFFRNRVNAHTKGRCQCIIPHGTYPTGRGGSLGAGSGVGAAGPGGGRHISCQPFLILGSLQILFSLGNFLHQVCLKLFGFVHHGFEFFTLGNQLRQQCVGFGTLFIQNQFRVVQFLPDNFQLFLFAFQLQLCGRHQKSSLAEFLQAFSVRRIDLLDHIDPVKQIGKIVGFKDDGPVGKLALLLHGPDPFFILVIQLCEPFLRIVQLILLIRNQQRIGCQLLVDIGHLLMEQRNFLVDGIFLPNQVLNLIAVFFILALDLLELSSDFLLLLLQFIELLADLAGRCSMSMNRDQTQQQSQQHDCRHHSRQNPDHFFAIIHSISPYVAGE